MRSYTVVELLSITECTKFAVEDSPLLAFAAGIWGGFILGCAVTLITNGLGTKSEKQDESVRVT